MQNVQTIENFKFGLPKLQPRMAVTIVIANADNAVWRSTL